MSQTAVERDVRLEFARAMDALTPLQRRFIRLLPECRFKKYSCAKRLGMSEGTVSKWMAQPAFTHALDLMREVEDIERDISRARIVAEYEAIAFANPQEACDEKGKVMTLDKLPAHVAVTVQEIELMQNGKAKPKKFMQKRHALDALAELHNITRPQRLEVTGKDGTPLMPAQATDLEIARRVAFILARGMHAAQQQPTAEVRS